MQGLLNQCAGAFPASGQQISPICAQKAIMREDLVSRTIYLNALIKTPNAHILW
jgi:hypothetical protein